MKKPRKLKLKDNTVDKKSLVEKRTKWVIEQMFSNHKKLRNEEKLKTIPSCMKRHIVENYFLSL